MGFQSRKIVEEAGINVDELITVLNKAYADEFLAWYQYYSVVGIAEGLFRKSVEDEFIQHAKEELEHAEMIKNRIIELDGIPLLNPQDWYQFTNCGYTIPNNYDTIILVEQNIKAEQCAIKVYNGIMEATKGLDPITYKLARNIMKDEEEHEQDLSDIKKDMLKTIEIIKAKIIVTNKENDLLKDDSENNNINLLNDSKIENKVILEH